MYLAASQAGNGSIYTSTSGTSVLVLAFVLITLLIIGGSTWSKSPAPTLPWYGIASDSTGMYLAAAVDINVLNTYGTGGIYTSSTGKLMLSSLYYHHHHNH